MKKPNFCLTVFSILVISFFSACSSGNPTGPDGPDNSKYYTLQVQYIRTEILNPDWKNTVLHLILYTLDINHKDAFTTQVDDYHLKCEFWDVKAGLDYYFHLQDYARYDGSDLSSAMVGDIFIVTVKETGFIKELKDIRPYNLSTNLHQGPKAKAAFFKLTTDGKIISDPSTY